eukprot:2979005-Rhodomonas_salina.1
MQSAIERIHESEKVVEIEQPTLDEVPEDDRAIVQNVLYAILACKHPDRLCTSWSVSCTNTQYVITALLPESDWDVSLVDLELVQSVSPLRIVSVALVFQSGNRVKLLVKILNGKQRVQLTEGDLVVRKKKRQIMSL